ncbi:hypothetical protein CKA32_006315 [Geitlerinema sp. FC II]|nr:hypothetical protein CKA32_006315 [Geitlerinema sp. FC II]
MRDLKNRVSNARPIDRHAPTMYFPNLPISPSPPLPITVP